MAAKKNNKNTNNNQTKEEALKEAALTSNTGDDIIVPSPLTKIADLRPGWIGDCCFRVIEESKEEEEEEDEDEKRRKQTQQHPNASSSSKQHQNSRRFREFLVGDVSGKIKFRCSEKREAEALKQNEAYLLKSGKIEMIRGQMRLMTDRMTFEKSAVTPLADEVNERRDVCEAKDCGELDLSALFFDRIQ
ncbi:unnamed protein product [Bathycoccus prasinos]